MADKNFGVKKIELVGSSGTPNLTSPTNLNLNANTVAISTDLTIGGKVQSDVIVGTGYSVGIGSTQPQQALDVTGASNFNGNITATKLHVDSVGSGVTYIEDLVVQGNARVTGILSIGTSSIVLDSNAKVIRGIEQLHIASREVNQKPIIIRQIEEKIVFRKTEVDENGNERELEEEATVGIGSTANINTTGIITATTFNGSLTGNVTGNVTGVAATFSGNVTIGGTLTYEDVTNIDSVGLITARSGINVTGVVTATSFDGDLTGTATTATNLNNQAASYYLNYNNFTNTPTIPTNNNQLTNGAGYITGYTVTSSDVTAHEGDITITESQISDFGTYATTASLATVATSGSYIDLSNKPTIPTNNNQLTNGAGYISSFDITTQTDSKYLRSNANDTASGDITFNGTVNIRSNLDLADNDILQFGSGDDFKLYNNGVNQYMDMMSGTGSILMRDGGVGADRFTFTKSTGNFTATGNVTAYSDITLKKNIELIPNALDKVLSLRGVTYNRTDIENEPKHSGIIAQEVEKVLPEVVSTNEEGIKSVAYGNMVGLLIEAIKELKDEIETLKKEKN